MACFNKLRNINHYINKQRGIFNFSTWIDHKNKLHNIKDEFISSNVRVKRKWVDLISWNILGPNQGESQTYEYSTLDARLWKRREQRIVDYLLLVRPQIICLQELSFDSISSDSFRQLAEVGYVCAAFAPSQQEQNRNNKQHSNTGCAIFVQQEKIAIISSHKLSLGNFAPVKNCRSAEYTELVNNNFHSMIACQFLLKATDQKFYVANTQISSNVDKDVRAIQAQSIINSLESLIKREAPQTEQDTDDSIPLILCGDFNTEPTMKDDTESILHPLLQKQNDSFQLLTHKLTAPFHIFTKGSLPPDHPEHPDAWCRKYRKYMSPKLGMFLSRFPKLVLSNVYLNEDFNSQQPLWTTKTNNYQGWVDHIWINSDVKVRRVLCPPVTKIDPQATKKDSLISSIPSKKYPSSHIPIGCVVSFPTKSSTTNQNQQNKVENSKE